MPVHCARRIILGIFSYINGLICITLLLSNIFTMLESSIDFWGTISRGKKSILAPGAKIYIFI